MATLGEVEEAIFEVEKVDVAFVHPSSGRDARSNKRGLTPYPHRNKLNGEYTISDLIRLRLSPLYDHHELKIVVKYEDGAVANGGTKIARVRKTFQVR